jgi:hypothetical protein
MGHASERENQYVKNQSSMLDGKDEHCWIEK